MPNQIPDIHWESMCHGCGKCCHSKYDLFVFAIADPVYVCKYLTSDNRCEVYEDRLSKNGCISLREAVKRTGLLPKSCGYIHLNPQHKELICPKSEEEFWEFIDLADSLLKEAFKGQKINLVSFVRNRRGKSDEFKLLPKTGWFQSVFLNKKIKYYIAL